MSPWTGKTFKKKHDQKLTTKQANKASKIANAILAENPGKEGMAIATAIKLATKPPKKKPTKK